jgi:hypothetical protein
MKRMMRFRYEVLVVVIWVIAVVAKVLFNGLILDFDYGIYQPDGKYYTFMTLEFLNHNPMYSAQQVVDWYSIHGVKMKIFTVEDLLPSTSPIYHLISHRVLYSLLSVPFVALIGIPGMLVIPSLSLLALLLSIQILARQLNKPIIGLILVILVSSSPTVMRWMILNCTDALLAGLFALVPFSIGLLEQKNRKGLFFLATLVVLTSATRFTLPIWLSIFLVLFAKKMFRKEVLLLTLLSCLAAFPSLNAQVSSALLPGEAEASTLSKLIKLPISLIKVAGIDILQFGVLDRILLLILICTLIQSIRLWGYLSSSLFLAVLIAVYVIGAINGTLGVNFRYQLPVLIFCAWLLLDSFEISNGKLSLTPPTKRHVVVDKIQKQLKA